MLTNTGRLRGRIRGGASGTSEYPSLKDKPQINGVTLEGNQTPEDLQMKLSQLANDAGYAKSSIVAPEYSEEATYDVGDYVTYENTLYKCNSKITTAEEWNPEHWTAVNVAEIVPTKTSDLNNDSGYTSSTVIAEAYDETTTYAVGEYVTHDNNLYKCNTAITTAEEWNAEHWTLVDVISAIPTKTSELDNDSGFITGDNYYDKSEIDTALSGKADKSDTYTKTETDNKIVGLIDDNSTANNKAWSASKIGGELFGITTETVLTLTADKFFNTNSVIGSGATTYTNNVMGDLEGTYCIKKGVSAGEKYSLSGVGGSNAVGFYILTGLNDNVISYDKWGSRQTPIVLNITQNGFLYVNLLGYSSSTDYVKQIFHTNGLSDEIDEVADNNQEIEEEITGEKTSTTISLQADKYINTTEVFRDGAITFHKDTFGAFTDCYCAKIATSIGEIYTIYGKGKSDSLGLYVLCDAVDNVISSERIGTRDYPVVLKIDKIGYLYVNLTDYDSNTDKIVRTTYSDGLEPSIDMLRNSLPFYNKKIVNFGDSIIGNKRPPYDVSTSLAYLTGATVYNCGFGGCRMAKHNLSNYDAFSMYRLAYAIANNDWSVQDSVDFSQLPTYFPEALALLKSIDFSQVSAITIAYGTNDLTGNVGLDNNNDLDDTDYYGGALRYSLDLLLATFPNLKIYVCGQTYRFWESGGVFTEDSDTYTNNNGDSMSDFIDKTSDISKEYHLQFIDNYYDLGINKLNRANWFPANDGTHHNWNGARLIAEHLARVMF